MRRRPLEERVLQRQLGFVVGHVIGAELDDAKVMWQKFAAAGKQRDDSDKLVPSFVAVGEQPERDAANEKCGDNECATDRVRFQDSDDVSQLGRWSI